MQRLLYGNRSDDVRTGFNLSTLMNDATVAFVEGWVQTAQEFPTQQRFMRMTAWSGFLVDRLDWRIMMRHTLEGRSRMAWIELRYRWDSTDIARQLRHNLGHRSCEFRAAPQRSSVQLSLRQPKRFLGVGTSRRASG